MYISKLFVKNYRSLRQAIVHFDSGKNVVVGKNNSGKSNIIRAIEILIGERFPTYVKFSDNDFHTFESINEETGEIKENISEKLFLEITVNGRDFDEECIRSIKKKTAFSKLKSISDLYEKVDEITGEIEVNFDLFENLDEIENRDEVETLHVFSNGSEKKTNWMDHVELLTFLQKSLHIKLFFCKSRIDDELSSFGMIVLDENRSPWISHFLSKKLRNSLITATVISALRSPKEDLRLVHYTWFGKLIENLWLDNKDKLDQDTQQTFESLISEKTRDIKVLVDHVFHKNTQEIRNLLKRAIAHKSVSFKFLNDGKSELYKNVRIFVNDGIDRPLDEKGTGIQSAIIIALFSQYCNAFHNRSSLLIAEEPELFLHPQSRRVISAELNAFLNQSSKQERQLIISTHSIDYLKNVEPKNIIRVYKDSEGNESLVNQLTAETSESISNEIKRTIWSANAEIFFADKVVLVEGGELYLLPSIIDNVRGEDQAMDYANYSIARVNGKGNFMTYIKLLSELNIQWFLLGDLDCYKDEIQKICSFLQLKEEVEYLSPILKEIAETPVDFKKIKKRIDNIETNYDAQLLQEVFERFRNQEIDSSDDKLLSVIEFMSSKYKESNLTEITQKEGIKDSFKTLQERLRKNGIFIWNLGELEDYYTEFAKSLVGSKDMKALEISYKIKEENEMIKYLNNIDEIKELVELIFEKEQVS